MSQKTSRKSQNPTIIVISDDNDKVETPVKEMKKKIAANAEKDKQTAEKTDKPAEKSDKNETADKNKSTEKTDRNADKNKSVEKTDKNADKNKSVEKTDKNADKTEKNVDKPAEKKSDKTAEKVPEKKSDKPADKVPEKKSDKSVDKKADPKPAEKDESKGDKAKEKGRGAVNGHNGAAGLVSAAGAHDTVSDGSEEDEAFPELTYDDSDTDGDDAPSRSLTRRSQSKVLKLTEVVAPPSDRKLRSADSPRPDGRKDKRLDAGAVQEEGEKKTKKDLESSKKDQEDAEKEPRDGRMEVEIADAESSEGPPRTHARVSPYSRARLDRTVTSVTADYTGNNSTMEMDITESSLLEDPSLNDSGYLRGLRGIRGRSSYKLLKELKLTNPNAGRPRPPPTAASRPTGAVVGRKRKPSPEPSPLSAVELGEEATDDFFAAHGKRMRLIDRLAQPFRRSMSRRAAEITGINTDLPLTAPVASASFSTFDPETIKSAPAPAPAPGEPVATPLPPHAPLLDRDGKRCVVM